MSQYILNTDNCPYVDNAVLYDFDESLKASGYPMRTKIELGPFDDKDVERCRKLVEATKTGNGAHSQFLTGIRVSFDLTFSNKAWVEAERYRFLEFVSSQSTMHRITKFKLSCQYNEYVDFRIVKIMQEKVDFYNEMVDRKAKGEDISDDFLAKLYLEILYSNPAGFQITARITTNYRCLRNIYIQRKNHRLPEWRAFCRWIATLPYAEVLLIN